MKFKYILTTLITLAGIGGATAATHLKALPPTVEMGVYDNYQKFARIHTLKYEMIWCDLDKYEFDSLLPQLKMIVAKGRTPIVTIEPFAIPTIGSNATLLPDITAGKYDAVILTMATEIDHVGSPVFVRFAPEMDCETDKPYARKPTEIFIPAYRRFVALLRQASPTSRLIWTTVGNPGGEKYYPGDDYVDYTGYSLYEQSDASKRWFGHERSFAEWMDEKYPAFAKIGKPIIITELGVTGSPAKKRAWLKAAFISIPKYPLVRALIYFNAQDLVSWAKWGAPGAPDWRIDPSVFAN